MLTFTFFLSYIRFFTLYSLPLSPFGTQPSTLLSESYYNSFFHLLAPLFIHLFSFIFSLFSLSSLLFTVLQRFLLTSPSFVSLLLLLPHIHDGFIIRPRTLFLMNVPQALSLTLLPSLPSHPDSLSLPCNLHLSQQLVSATLNNFHQNTCHILCQIKKDISQRN